MIKIAVAIVIIMGVLLGLNLGGVFDSKSAPASSNQKPPSSQPPLSNNTTNTAPSSANKNIPQLNQSKIMYISKPSDNSEQQICVINSDGSNNISLDKGYNPHWSRDGKQIAFAKERELYCINSNGANLSLVYQRDNNLFSYNRLSHNFDQIAFSKDDSANDETIPFHDLICLVNLTNKNIRNIAKVTQHVGSLEWSPDDKQIALIINSFPNITSLCILDTTSCTLNEKTGLERFVRQLQWSPDSKNIACSTYTDNFAYQSKYNRYIENIYIMSLSSNSNIVNIHGEQPSWAPDNTKLAFTCEGDIYTSNSSGENRINLTNNKKNNIQPSWSPDGKQIAFSSNRDGIYEIYIMNADGSDQTKITTDGWDKSDKTQPVWSPK